MDKKNKLTIIIHRVNTIEKLITIPHEYGVEIDVRGYGNTLLLNHDPIDSPEKYTHLEEYLKYYRHSFIIFNMKEAGYEQKVIDIARSFSITDFFLLDVEFPYLYKATRINKFKKIAIRYSEIEPIEMVLAQRKNGETLLDWVWIDTNTMLPLNKKIMESLKGFKTCLVCPERWGRPQDIEKYKIFMAQEEIKIDAVMTSLVHAEQWLQEI